MKKIITLIIGFAFSIFNLYAQVFEKPIAAKQSHPELEITKIEITESNTIVSLTITNKLSQGGWFCADKNISLKNSNGDEIYELLETKNIPTCPDQFEFAYAGQTLEFQLVFPPISDQIKFVDLIENCSNACFSFYGIILDNQHNENIRSFEKGFELYQEGKMKEAMPYFEKVVSDDISINSHIYGLAYYYLILINANINNTEKVNFWYTKLMNSSIEEKETFIKELEQAGIKK